MREDDTVGKAPIKHGSLVAKAYEDIKEKIITLYFLPGQYLNEAAISGLLQVGRTPVHQALQRLELEGLVEIMPRKGVVVLPDSISEIIKILEGKGARVGYNDPYVPELRLDDTVMRSQDLIPAVRASDVVVIVTDHSAYPYRDIVEAAPVIVDTRNATKGIRSPKIVKI